MLNGSDRPEILMKTDLLIERAAEAANAACGIVWHSKVLHVAAESEGDYSLW